MASGATSKFGAPPCSNLMPFGSKCVFKRVLVTFLGLFGAPAMIRRLHSDSAPGELCPPFYAPASIRILWLHSMGCTQRYKLEIFLFSLVAERPRKHIKKSAFSQAMFRRLASALRSVSLKK